jgi:hypothetical protein
MTGTRRPILALLFSFASVIACGQSADQQTRDVSAAPQATSPRSVAGAGALRAASLATAAGPSHPQGSAQTIMASDSYWYRDVSSDPVADESSSIISAIDEWGNGNHFDVDFAFNIEHASASDPTYEASLDPGYDPDNDHTAVPVPAGGALENEPGYVCTDGGDCHLIVLDASNHSLFEIWQANLADGSLSGTQESVWDTLAHYGPSGRGLGCTSADAAGLPILPGIIGVEETHAGEIAHAIRFILPNTKIRSAFVTPATHLTGAASSTNGPPYGTRLRLKASFDVSTLPSEGARTVARALQTYGMILADGGQTPISAERDQLYGADMSWDGLLAFGDLRSITPYDFDVVDFSTPQHVTDCTRTSP